MRRARITLHTLGVTAIALFFACAPPASENESAATPSGTPVLPGEPPCTTSPNPIDQAVCPRLTAAQCASGPRATPVELCRRLYVDLVGTLPTPADTETVCKGRDARAIATTLMATPAYVRQQQELWGEILEYDPTQIHGMWLADADAIVARLVTGEMRYDDFAKRILAHPVFGVGARLPRSDLERDEDRYFPQVARLALKVFLGRAPIAGDDVALGKLFRFWKKNNVIHNVDYGRTHPVLAPRACPCKSTVFGVATSIELPLDGDTAYEAAVNAASTTLQAELDKVGALFVAQPSFWTQAVDLAMHMLLGWWKTTLNQDESVLPEVQAALAARFAGSPSRSWRDLLLDIVSSDLYVRSNRVAVDAREDLPVHCSGPLRMMRPEAYVSSLGKLLSVRVGRCDHRTNEPKGRFYPDGSEGSFFPHDLREDEDSDAKLLGVTDYHYVAVRAMGGCSAGLPRSEAPTLPLIFGAAPAAQTVCNASTVVLPPRVGQNDKSREAIDAIADHLSGLLLGRPPTDAERAAAAKDAAACVSDATCDARSIAVDMCAALARSMDAITY